MINTVQKYETVSIGFEVGDIVRTKPSALKEVGWRIFGEVVELKTILMDDVYGLGLMTDEPQLKVRIIEGHDKGKCLCINSYIEGHETWFRLVDIKELNYLIDKYGETLVGQNKTFRLRTD